jgi:crotonobetainyl-CoA:carnitine CoA-transferase CaiB-like acyl-CoA transferase
MAGPLEGLKVLDFTTLLPGPFATMTLADLGADILRIVSPSRPDLATFMPPFIPSTKISAIGAYLGRGKRSINLNLKDSRTQEVVRRMIGQYDILVEQFRPGVMARCGLDYESLYVDNPKLIYCSITGYGQTGPLQERAGHDINYLSRSGLMGHSGRKTIGPVLTGMQIADIASGSFNAIIGILAAVVHRHATGRGQHIDVSMTDGVMAFNAMFGAAFLATGTLVGREEGFLNGGSLYDFYETSDGEYISVGSIEPQFFAAFCSAIGRPDLEAGSIAPQNLDRVKAEVRAIFKTKTREEWVAIFKKVDACVEPVLSLDEAFQDDLTKQRAMIVDVPLPNGGTVRQLANPIKFSRSQQAYKKVGAEPGTHTKEVFLELGYSEAQIDEFEQTGLFR